MGLFTANYKYGSSSGRVDPSPLLTAVFDGDGNSLMNGPKRWRRHSYLGYDHMMQKWMTSMLLWDAAITIQSLRSAAAGSRSRLEPANQHRESSPRLTSAHRKMKETTVR